MVNPRWRICVDWNENGIWGQEDGAYREDVAGDVLELDWRWGRPVNPEETVGRRAIPARLDLLLRNQDGRYSPGNGASPLAGNIHTGRRVWAALAWPLDDFDGTAGTDLHGRKPTLTGGQGWLRQPSGDARLVMGNGRVNPTARTGMGAGTGDAIYTLDFGAADAGLGFRYRRSSDGSSGVVLRFISRWDYLRVRFGNTGTFLEDVTFGYPAVLRRGEPLLAGVEYFIEVELHGSSVRLFATDLDSGGMDRKQILDGGGTAGNAASTLHGIWHDGSQAAVADSFGSFGGWRSLFHGFLSRISPERHADLGRVCRFQARDDLAGALRTPLHRLLTGRNLSSGDIGNAILTWAGFSADNRLLDSGRTLVATEPRALWRQEAGAALDALSAEESGLIYMDGRGYVRLEAAGHRNSGAHAVNLATFRDTSASGPYFSHLAWSEGVDRLENSVTFRYPWGANQGLREIWRLGDVTAIPAGETRDFLAESYAFDVVDSIRSPVAVTDYAANSRRDGQGDNLTASLKVTLPSLAGASYGGRGTVVRVENGHASATAYLSLLRLRADRSYKTTELTSYRAEATESQGRHGLRAEVVECRFIDNYDAARAGAEARLAQRGSARRRLALTIRNGNQASAAQVVHRVLSDRVRVVCGNPVVVGDFFIEGMEISAVSRSGHFESRWLLEEA